MRISDWSSDVCSSDLREDFVAEEGRRLLVGEVVHAPDEAEGIRIVRLVARREVVAVDAVGEPVGGGRHLVLPQRLQLGPGRAGAERSEEHTSELQSLMRNSYAVFCLKKKKTKNKEHTKKKNT